VARLDELVARLADPDPLVRFCADVNGLVVAVHEGAVTEALRRSAGCEAVLADLDPGETGTVMLPLGQQVLAVTFRAFNAWAHLLAGDRSEARRQSARAREVTDRSGHGFTRAFAGTVEGLVAAMDGSPEWAADAVAWTVADHEIDEYGLGTIWIHLLGAWADGLRADAEGAAAAADRVRDLVTQLDEIGAHVCITQYLGMLAELELAAGRPDAALAAVDDGIERTSRHGERYWLPGLERLRSRALSGLDRAGQLGS
jgi:hypothetical protein